MPGIIDAIRFDANAASDTTHPPQLSVGAAVLGNFTAGAAKVDPLYIELGNVEPGCRLEILNLSAKPDATWADAQALPVTNQLASTPRRTFALALSDREMQKLGLSAGDVFQVRQVDAAGNASAPTQGRLAANVTTNNLRLGQVDRYEQIDVQLPPGVYSVQTGADTRPPVVLPGNLAFGLGQTAGQGVLSGSKAIEAFATVALRNERTGVTFQAPVNAEGAVTLTFDAQIGDPITVWVLDASGLKTDVGTRPFAPVTNAVGCRRAGG